MSHRCLSEAELLELALEGDERARRAASAACARCADELASLERLVRRTRTVLGAERLVASQDAERVAARVLARTTREDPSVRGDLRLVLRFVGEELRRSRILRLVAASLLVHLLALPVLAWYGFLRPRGPDLVLRFEPPREPAPFAPRTEEVLGPLETAVHELGEASSDSEREALRGLRIALPPLDPEESTLERLLRARAEQAVRPAWRPLPPPEAASPLEQALLAELWLDRYVLEGSAPPELEESLTGLGESLADLTRAGTAAVAPRRFALATLARAARHDLLPEPARQAFERALEDDAEALLAGGARGPADPRWLELLRRALPPEQQESALVRAWLEAR